MSIFPSKDGQGSEHDALTAFQQSRRASGLQTGSHALGQGANSLDMDEGIGMQPVDINSIGSSEQRVSKKMLFGILGIGVVVLLFLGVLLKYVAGPWIDDFLHPKPKKIALDERPTPGNAQLPGAQTPLEMPSLASDEEWVSKDKKWVVAGAKPGAKGAVGAVGVGKGIALQGNESNSRDSKQISGQPSAQVPPIGVTPNGQPVGVSALADRYGGDSTLSTTRRTAQTGGMLGLPQMGGIAGAGSGFGSVGLGTMNSSGAPYPASAGAAPGLASTQIANALSTYLAANTNAAKPGAGAVGTTAALGATQNPILATTAGAGNAGPNTQGNVGGLLSPTKTEKALAVRAFDPSLTVAKGDSIDCAMTTRVVTEISGFTSCIVTSNVYSVDGKVLLIERMSEVQGEYAAVGAVGQRRVYVLWSRIRKPGGITIDIASPSTDQLGAAGIEGVVDNRWFERIGSAYMLSIFKDFLAGAATPSGSNGTVLFQNTLQTSNSLADKVLSQSINIKPVVYANQGDRVAIYVARDLDFSSVYSVRKAN